MSEAQFNALVRQLLTAGSMFMAGQGYMSGTQAELLAGALGTLASLGWSLWAARNVGVVTAAAKLRDVEKIEVRTHALADKVPSEKVTT